MNLNDYHHYPLVFQIWRLADYPDDWISIDLSLYYMLLIVLVF
jgi:hypothetical protein